MEFMTCNKKACPAAKDLKCSSKTDLVMLLDGSGSLTTEAFEQQKAFATDLSSRFTLGKDKGCAAPSIYTGSRVCKGPKKVDCQYKKMWMNGKGYDTITKCSKWDKKNCDTWGGSFNHGAKVSLHGPRPKFCHEMTNQDKGVCRCAGKNNNWKGKGKPCFQGPNPPTTEVCRVHKKCKHVSKYVKKCWLKQMKGSSYNPNKVGKICKKEVFKQGPWTPAEKIMGGCNDQGYAYADTCAFPKGIKRAKPKPKKPRCSCTVKGWNWSKKYTVGKGHKSGHISMYKKKGNMNKKSFKSIHCTNCVLVRIYDDDDQQAWKKSDIHDLSYKKNGCCSKKGCSWTATHDFEDDVKKIELYTEVAHHKCGK